jgi:hypothetical protein
LCGKPSAAPPAFRKLWEGRKEFEPAANRDAADCIEVLRLIPTSVGTQSRSDRTLRRPKAWEGRKEFEPSANPDAADHIAALARNLSLTGLRRGTNKNSSNLPVSSARDARDPFSSQSSLALAALVSLRADHWRLAGERDGGGFGFQCSSLAN